MPGDGSWGRRGRSFPIDTPLGRAIWHSGLKLYQVAARAEISPRMLTEYLAERRRISDDHLEKLSRALDVPAADIADPSVVNVTDSTGMKLTDLQQRQAALRSQIGRAG